MKKKVIICAGLTHADRLEIWMEDLESIRQEMLEDDETVLASHLQSITADLQFQLIRKS